MPQADHENGRVLKRDAPALYICMFLCYDCVNGDSRIKNRYRLRKMQEAAADKEQK